MFDLIEFFMTGKAIAAPGQQEWEALDDGSGTRSHTFAVPTGVTRLSMVCAGYSRVVVDGVNVCSSYSGSMGTGSGANSLVGSGGNGGAAGVNTTSATGYGIGGGGSGGYTGNGGAGANHSGNFSPVSGGIAGGDGSGGGGGGGGSMATNVNAALRFGGRGGGVGLKGLGASGLGGAANAGGGGGSGGDPGGAAATTASPGGKYGGGASGDIVGYGGAPLRYVNDVPVNAGSVVRVFLAPKGSGGVYAMACGARIMWGGGRSYPSNAGDL